MFFTSDLLRWATLPVSLSFLLLLEESVERMSEIFKVAGCLKRIVAL